MVDIHCHILPGIDDGASDMEESVAMARMAALDGITHIVATPHVKHELLDTLRIAELVGALNCRLKDEGVDVTVLAGADVSAVMSPSLLRGYTINATEYLLIEFPHTHLPSNANAMVFGFAASGFRPIVTHPERNISIIRDPLLAEGLVQSGGLLQLTAGSLTGDFGPAVRKCALRILRQGLVHFIASDAHSSSKRPPVLSTALKAAYSAGYAKADTLVKDNPATVISGGVLEA